MSLGRTDGGANTDFILGASLARGGLALSVLSIFLFTAPAKTKAPDQAETPAVSMLVLPVPGAATLSFRCRF